MRKTINSLIGLLTIILIFLSITGCEKMPEQNWNEELQNTVWTNGEYTLKSSLQTNGDTTNAFLGINGIWAVVNAQGVVVTGVNFTFGDGGSATGGQVMHAYQAIGSYTLTVYIPGGPTKTSIVLVLPFGNPVTTSVVKQIYHNYSNGTCYDTIGLMVEYISGYQAPGWYFASGDFNSWPTPPNSLALATTRIIDGKTYALWAVTHTPGLEKMNFGKNFTGGGFAWNYSPSDPYWHVTTGGGELWIYFTATGISPTPGGPPATPGEWGDPLTNWFFRGTVTSYGTTTAITTLYVNKEKIINPQSPQLYYKLNNNSWLSTPLVDNGTYYSAQVVNIVYGSLVYFYALAQSGVTTSKVAAGSVMYNTVYECCIIQINEGILPSKAVEPGVYMVYKNSE